MTVHVTPGYAQYVKTWDHLGYCGSGHVEELFGTLRGQTAVVCGSADTLFDDFTKCMEMMKDGTDVVVFGANEAGAYLPDIDHFVSLHDDKIPLWRQIRWGLGYINRVVYHSYTRQNLTKDFPLDYVWENISPCFALSGYFAMQIAYLMEASRIILCGCTGDNTKRFFDLKSRGFGYGGNINSQNDKGIVTQLINEMNRLPDFKAKVASMSGKTADYFGGPERWLRKS